MHIVTPHRDHALPATRALIAEIVAELPTRPADPFLIIGPAADELTYAQACWTGTGFELEYQEGTVDRHYRSERRDLSVAQVTEALGAYLDGNPAWRYAFRFEPKVIRPLSYRMGHRIGWAFGRLKSWLAG